MRSRLPDRFCRIAITVILFLYFFQGSASAQDMTMSNEIEKDYILIINSHTQFDEQGKNIAEEIRRQIKKKDSSEVVIINYAQMNTQTSIINMRFAIRSFLTRYKMNSGIVIIIGDEAWMTYRVMRLHSWSKAKVILCCVHDEITSNLESFLKTKKLDKKQMIPTADSTRTISVTGVYEQYNTKQTISLMKKMLPQMEEVLFISTGTYADAYIEYKLRQTIQSHFPELSLKVQLNNQAEGKPLSDAIPLNNPKQGVLANLWYRTHRQLLDSIQRTNKLSPIFLLNERSLVDDKTIGGCYPTSKCYADSVIELIRRINNDEKPSSIPFKTVIDTTPRINMYSLQSYNLSKEIPGAVFYNYPPTFFQRTQNYLAVLLIFLIISFSFLIMSRNAIRFKKRTTLLYKKSKDLYDEFIMASEIMPMALYIFDEDGKLLRKNGEASRNIGENGIISDAKMSLFDVTFLKEEDKKAIRNLEPLDLDLNEEQRVIIRYTSTMNITKQWRNNNTIEIIVILIESHALNQERIKSRSFRSIFEHAMKASNMGVAEYNLIDKKGFATKTWYDNLNLKEEDGFKDPLASINESDRREIQNFLLEARRGINNNFNRNVQIRNSRGEMHWFNYAIYVMAYSPSEGRIMIAETCVNIDDQKEREFRLEQEMKKAQESDLLKSAFIANMSHEIRTPLNAIIGFSDLLIEAVDPNEKEELMRHIEYNNASLLGLVEDIIELARVESEVNRLIYAETDLNFLLNDLVLYCQMEGARKNLTVSFIKPEKSCLIITDKMRLKQVISNFVTNALKFTKSGGITIGYELIGDKVKISVSDTGIGISEEGCRKVFNRFVVLDHGIKGNGLGLSISKSIIEHLDGEIGVDSVEGKGSTFWCIIPRNKDLIITDKRIMQSKEESLSSSENTVSKELCKGTVKILIAEDNEQRYAELKELFKGDFQLTHSVNGEEVIELFLNDLPDIIFMDLDLPIASGYEATAAIRNIASDLPVIATIDRDNASQYEDLLKKGFSDVICHPYMKEELNTIIEKWIMKGGKE